MTRARDYLIFAAKNTKPAAVEWLTSLRNTDNSQVLSLPQVPGKQNIQVGNAKFPCKVLSLDSRNVKPQGSIAGSSISSYTSKKLLYPLAHRLPYRLIPSAHSSDKIEPKPDTASDTSKKTPIISIGARLPLAGSPDMRDVGDALHRFLAVDNIAYPDDERLECATAMLKRWNVTALNPDSLVLASTRLNSFITDQFGACKRLAECPITGRIGNQRVSGRLDLLIETDAGYIIIDHKSFPGKFDEWVARAQSHKPQLDVYKQVVEQATSRPVLQILIHMPIVASIISLV
jgi:ATP-dependent exoDNAse (exonuclease V) beta subunit